MHETDKAVLSTIAGDQVWIPRSQITASLEVRVRGSSDNGELHVTKLSRPYEQRFGYL
jgi:hypothetical protein